MYLFYIDGSEDGHFYTYSALGIKDVEWKAVTGKVLQFRKTLRQQWGIYIRKELHATKFCSGRGRPSDRHLSLHDRAEVFRQCLRFVSTLSDHKAILFNAALNRQEWAYERLVNRINRTMQSYGDLALLICDEGNENEYIQQTRRMGKFNPIPSQFGAWNSGGQTTKNITIDHVVEDPLFKKSHQSTYIQFVDFCAYALLRQEKPLASKTALGLHAAFPILEPVCFKQASKHQLGIIK